MRMAFSLLLPVRVRMRTSICKALQPGASWPVTCRALPPWRAGSQWELREDALRPLASVACRPKPVRAKGGGEGGIRTHGRLAPTPVFKTGALNHSATSPDRIPLLQGHTLCKLCGRVAFRLRKASKFQCRVHHSGGPSIGWVAGRRYLNDRRVKGQCCDAVCTTAILAYHGDVSA